MILRRPPAANRGSRGAPFGAPGAGAAVRPATQAPPKQRPTGRLARVFSRDTDVPLSRDPFRLVLLALLVQTVSKVASFLGPMALTRPAVVLFSLCLIFALANAQRVFNKDLLKYPVPRLILAQGVVACGSVLFGISLGNAAVFILNVYWKTLVFAFLLMTSLRTAGDLRRTVWATALAGITLAFIGLFIVGVSKDTGVEQYDGNDVGLIMVMTLPLALLVLQTSKGRARLVALFGLGLIAACIVKTQSRGAFIGGACVGIALLLLLPGVSIVKRVSALGAIIVTMVIFAPPGYWEAQKKLILDPQSDYNWDAVDGRRMIAKRGIGYMMAYPAFGIGINNFEMAEGTISPYAQSVAGTDIGVKWSAPHNSWIEVAAETGVPGLVIWALLIVGSSVSLLKLRKRMPREWANSSGPDPEARFLYLSTLYIPISFLGFMVAATFVSFAWSDQSYILPALAMGVHLAYQDKMRGTQVQTAPAQRVQMRGRRQLRPRTA